MNKKYLLGGTFAGELSLIVFVYLGIPVLPYVPPDVSGLYKLRFKPLIQLKTPYIPPKEMQLDLLWHAAHFFQQFRPGWSGYMTDVSAGSHPGKAEITMLPIIDLDPTDISYIHSTLMFVLDQAKHLEVATPCITFDQPLWLKATEIINALSLNMIVILGGFHTMMSFAGSIGSSMDGTGLTEGLKTIFGGNAVKHIISGKAISRALRAHFLVEAALVTKLMSHLFPTMENQIGDDINEKVGDDKKEIHYIEEEDGSSSGGDIGDNFDDYESDYDETVDIEVDDIQSSLNNVKLRKLTIEEAYEIKELYDSISNSSDEGLQGIESRSTFKLISDMLEELKDELCKSSRTARLWIQYLDYVAVLKQYIRAERTGNWKLHLDALRKMINLFAATGHIHYAKSARLHLKQMRDLHINFPWVYTCFTENGYHTVRRSDHYWAGLWTDLIIEQVMMRSLKSRGGLSRGRGITESVRLLWLGSMHRCAGVHDAMTTLTKLKLRTSEQHVELTTSRSKRDNSDIDVLLTWFNTNDPFYNNLIFLRCLSSGLTIRSTAMM